ncbi:spore germination protein [Paenibacillus rigui]|nr:spore germination protein [Paenibacillus rigui]
MVAPALADNLAELQIRFQQAPDLVVCQFTHVQRGVGAALVYLEGLTDKNAVNNNILRPLMYAPESAGNAGEPQINVGYVRHLQQWNQIEHAILYGRSVLFIDGTAQAQAFDTQGWPQRAVEDPQLEASLKGAHQGFIETLSDNIAMIRRYIPNRDLTIKEMTIGKRAPAKCSMVYLGELANPELVQEMEQRLGRLDLDCLLNTGELAEYIEDNPYSPFPQFIVTERPDGAASQLLQGRICVLLDRSPSVIVAPASIISFFQNIDDYSTRWPVASFIRLLRCVGFFTAAFLPAIYIALISFNHEVIPLYLILSIGEYRGRVPFSPLVEAMLMEITLEMLREAGVRLPGPIGQTVGIVGGIVIGQAAVQAGLVSNIMVVVVASTAIASFIIPNYDMASAIRLIRFPIMLLSSMFGIIGIVVGSMALIGHIISLESLGTPYGTPFAPIRYSDWKDTFLRLPLWKMRTRPKGVMPLELKRMNPKPPERGEQ